MSQEIPCPHCSAPDWQKVTVEGEEFTVFAADKEYEHEDIQNKPEHEGNPEYFHVIHHKEKSVDEMDAMVSSPHLHGKENYYEDR
jgi:hypothetical protein